LAPQVLKHMTARACPPTDLWEPWGSRDELEVSRASRKRAWENLQEIRWILKNPTGTARLSNHPDFLESEVFRPTSKGLSNDQVIKEADLQDPRAG
jgi:hypothetical protein